MSLKEFLRNAASADSTLSVLLGTNPFRWYDKTLLQGSAFPAVVAQQISNQTTYTNYQRLTTSDSRWQFTIWGGQYQAGEDACEALVNALTEFFDEFNAEGIDGLASYPNEVLNVRDAVFADEEGAIQQRVVDVKIFSNSAAI